ncbi:alpha/beta fold hydrolase [Phenylobacterium sp.]|jgi:pimeloyl-ACP methyl ester carboxylesterase|uniref:alpha/beta fold hydrolase n=1 Tax=Phenylobacterium sp. TaxID=1871053 RepID=UPI0037CCA08E
MANELTDKPKADGETYDDRPFHSDNLPPEVRAPLAPFEGAEPPSPKWFQDAIAQEPERGFVTSHGAKLEVLTWGELGKPGLLLIHGNSAHADWWSFIGPLLAKDFRVTAMSLAGMGASDWRETYRFTDFADDAEAVSRSTGLYDGGRKPVYIGHSFGGGQVFFAAIQRPENMHAAVLVDTGFGGPPPEALEERKKRMEQIRNIPTADRPSRIYPTVAAALARFRLMPPQPTDNLYIADFIARRSLKQVPMADGSGMGWTWKFDPQMWEKLDRSAMTSMVTGSSPEPAAKDAVPMVHLYGDKSRIIESRRAGEPSVLAGRMREIEIPDSHHHVMIDQPLALVAALRTLLAIWPDKTPTA